MYIMHQVYEPRSLMDLAIKDFKFMVCEKFMFNF